ncbi:MAG: tetratricopeptide repeat protein [Candidatus Zixiibacteriota bacterium]|nr:MAG: tetratricopeptide repeat protein [candidate division Zixibacteria bacterium]
METYRISSTLNEKDREYLIQTVNDANEGAVRTTVYVNGIRAESVACPHPQTIDPERILTLVKLTHGEKKKELELLLKAYRRVFELNDIKVMFQLGSAFFYKGFFEEARELFATVTRLQEDHHQAYHYLGQANLELGRLQEALAAATKAVSLRPGFADYRNTMGEVHLANNDWQAAMTEFETATSINLYYADAYFNLGLAVLLQAMSLHDRAKMPMQVQRIVDCLNKASLIDPEFRGDVLNGAIEALRNHDFTTALSTLKGLSDQKKERHRRDFSNLYMRFVLHPEWVSDQVVSERIKFLEEEIRKNPNYVDLMAELAHCYLEQARLHWQKGVEQYKKTLDVNPGLKQVREIVDDAEATFQTINRTLDALSARELG